MFSSLMGFSLLLQFKSKVSENNLSILVPPCNEVICINGAYQPNESYHCFPGYQGDKCDLGRYNIGRYICNIYYIL